MTPDTSLIVGLNNTEVEARVADGKTNNYVEVKGRSYQTIIHENVFTFINLLLVTVSVLLVIFGSFSESFLYFSVALLNVVVGLTQELNAKRKLDNITDLTSPKAKVIRSGIESIILTKDIVLDDVIKVKSGDLISVDGRILQGTLEVDESLLTGESDLISKDTNSEILSGSLVATGSALFVATRVGANSTSAQITIKAKSYQQYLTPLQREVNVTIRILLLVALILGCAISLSSVLTGNTFASNLKLLAVILGIIPNSLFAMINLSYALGGVRILKRGALVQKLNAIESLSNIDILCLDKTGTLTTKNLILEKVIPINSSVSIANLETQLGSFAASTIDHNATSQAIYNKYQGEKFSIRAQIPFNSAYKWSGLTLESNDKAETFILGAPEVILGAVSNPNFKSFQTQINQFQEEGLRVLVFGTSALVLEPKSISSVVPNLPQDLELLGILVFSDQIRPEVATTLAKFREAGIMLKVISGDNPGTVLALAKQINFGENLGPEVCISGPEIDLLSDLELQKVSELKVVFGRITPFQKERLVKALINAGHYVAMVGDGVNDVMSLKQANLGIAMESGSQATRSVADILLLNDSFASLPQGLIEGQKIRNGLEDVFKIFLTRIAYLVLLIIVVRVAGLPFPFTIKQSSLLAGFTTSLPAIGLTLWAHSGVSKRRNLSSSVIHFVLPAALTLVIFGTALLAYLLIRVPLPLKEAILSGRLNSVPDARSFFLEMQSALTTFLILAGLSLPIFVAPPFRQLVNDSSKKPDFRPIMLSMFLIVVFYFGFISSPIHSLWDLEFLSPNLLYIIFNWFLAWAVTTYVCWKFELLDKFLGISLK